MKNKKEYVWVIQDEDGYFQDYKTMFNKYLQFAEFYMNESSAKYAIDLHNLKNCKPVKVEIRLVEERLQLDMNIRDNIHSISIIDQDQKNELILNLENKIENYKEIIKNFFDFLWEIYYQYGPLPSEEKDKECKTISYFNIVSIIGKLKELEIIINED